MLSTGLRAGAGSLLLNAALLSGAGPAPPTDWLLVPERVFDGDCAGSDVGVFDHGDNAWELELMVDYGMAAIEVLRSANPGRDVSALRRVRLVMKDGALVRRP